MQLVQDIRLIYDSYGFDAEILTASAQQVAHLLKADCLGSDMINASPKVFQQPFEPPMIDRSLAAFLEDWAEVRVTLT